MGRFVKEKIAENLAEGDTFRHKGGKVTVAQCGILDTGKVYIVSSSRWAHPLILDPDTPLKMVR